MKNPQQNGHLIFLIKTHHYIIFIAHPLMFKKVTGGIHSFLRMCDLFAVSQFVKYKGESEFKTATGGFCSVTILTIFAILFMSVAIKTVNKQIITWTSQTTNEMEPSPTNVTVSPSPFLFTIGVMYLDLNDPNVRYFDFALTQRTWGVGGIELSNRSVPLVPCTQQHFAITESLRQTYHKNPAKNWLCPPLSHTFLLSGKFTSQTINMFEVSVFKCDPSLNTSRPCASAVTMQAIQAMMGQFILTQFFINPLLNPGSANYIDYYLQDRNYIAFTSKLGGYSTAHVQEYTVTTDQSILPYTVPTEESGVIVPDLFQNINFEVTSNRLAQVFFYKSSSSTTYSRSFYKLDEFFSYVGGLVGVIMGGMLLLSSYNQDSFELSLAKDLCRGERKQDSAFAKFNLAQHLMLSLHSIMKMISNKFKIERVIKFQQMKQQMAKQLDISLILKRILFLQRSVQCLFQRGQFEALHLSPKLTFQHIKVLRSYYRIGRFFNIHKNKSKDSSAGLKQTQKNLQLGIGQTPQSERSDQQSLSSSDSEQFDGDMKAQIQQQLKDFERSVIEGNATSLRISKEVSWKDIQLDQKVKDQDEIINIQNEIKQAFQISDGLDPKTQILRVKSNLHRQKIQQSHFEFIDFTQ